MHSFSLSCLKKSGYAVLLILGCALVTGCSQEPPTPGVGEQVFNKTCKVCHAQGLNGAPIFGNKKMWAERVPKGIDVLVDHASNGFGLMPAKGGNEALTVEEIRAAVTYMVNEVK